MKKIIYVASLVASLGLGFSLRYISSPSQHSCSQRSETIDAFKPLRKNLENEAGKYSRDSATRYKESHLRDYAENLGYMEGILRASDEAAREKLRESLIKEILEQADFCEEVLSKGETSWEGMGVRKRQLNLEWQPGKWTPRSTPEQPKD